MWITLDFDTQDTVGTNIPKNIKMLVTYTLFTI